MVTLDRLVSFLDTLLGNAAQVERIDPYVVWRTSRWYVAATRRGWR